MEKQSTSRSAFFNPRVLIGFVLCSIGLLVALVALSKSVTETSATTGTANPVPLINQPLVPDAIAPGGPGFTLTVNGTGFVSGSVVNWNGGARATTFVSTSQLTTTIPASDIASASTASVTVVNPDPGGGESNAVFFPVTSPTSSVSFKTSEYATGTTPVFLAIGDFNGDSKLDAAVANFGSNTVSLFLGNGDGTFQARVDYATGGTPSSVTVGDFNGDGQLDLVLTNGTFSLGNSVSVLLGNGDGTFQTHMEYGTGLGPTEVVVGDFNFDGKLDLAVANYGPAYRTGSVSILLGNGDGTFQPHVDYRAGVNPVGVLVGDFNRDSKLDLAVLNNNPPFGVSILLGNGDGSFQKAAHYDTGTNPRVGMVADFNSDGNLDLAVANFLDNNLSILLGNGDGTFQTHVNYPAGTNPSGVMGGDLNGDGKLDLVIVNYTSNNVSVLLGQGDGTFQSHVDYRAGSGPAQLGIGDFNTDGRLDIVTANSLDNTVSVLLQRTPNESGTCLPPPSGLVSWWSGDKTANDVQGINPGELVGGASYKRGMVGPGFLLDGINDGTVIPNSPSLSQTRITLDAWVFPTGRQGMHRHIISKDYELRQREYILSLENDNKFATFVQLPDGPKQIGSTTVAQPNTWYHVAMTHDGNTLRLYVNGVLENSLAAVGDIVPSANPVGIGWNRLPVLFQGIIDEAQIFNRALSDAEILAIYQAGAAGQCKPEIFVSSIDPSYTVAHSHYLVSTSIAVQDTNGIGTSDATANVKTLFPNGSELVFPVLTDDSGNASFSFYTSETGLYKFKVIRVSHPIRIYDASLNIETSDTLVIP